MRQRLTHDERHAQILEEAASLFARKGYYRTTAREIARKVGVSEAMIFKHFLTKEKLYSAILDAKAQGEDPLADIMMAAQSKDDEGVFYGLARHYFQRVEKDPALLRLLLFSALEHHRLSDAFVENYVLRIHEFLRQYIQGRITEGAFCQVNPLLAARSFVGMISHHLLAQEIFRMKKRYPLEKDETISTFVKIFLQGLRR